MATTSPDNLRTPNPGDPYNLVADLATLSGDVQSALNTRANAYTGTASQRAAFLSTATVGTLWQDTDGIGMLWKRAATAWVPAVWRWSGSSAQMNAFTQAPPGFEWFNTGDQSDYIKGGSTWTRSSRTISGRFDITTSTSEAVSRTITFPAGLFSTPPNVVVSNGTGITTATPLHIWVSGNPSTTSATISVARGSATSNRIYWIASS